MLGIVGGLTPPHYCICFVQMIFLTSKATRKTRPLSLQCYDSPRVRQISKNDSIIVTGLRILSLLTEMKSRTLLSFPTKYGSIFKAKFLLKTLVCGQMRILTSSNKFHFIARKLGFGSLFPVVESWALYSSRTMSTLNILVCYFTAIH